MSMEYTKKEPHRTSEKNALSISDRGRDEGLKKFLRLASQLLGTHGSYITVLTDEQHIVRASYNIELQDSSREQALCRHVVEGGATVVVADTCRDARFAHHPLITHAPFIRFYVGTPLKNKNGLMLGTLCVTDTVPRAFDNQQKNIFESLAALVVAFLDAWHSAAFVEPVTGLANRERLVRDIQLLANLNDTASRRLVLIDCIDMSRAFELSRSLGMASLESLLKDVATLLPLRLRPISGGMLYTIATGRFAILTHTDSHISARWVVERLNGISADVGDGLTMALTTCVGQTDFVAGDAPAHEVLRRAVNALEYESDQKVSPFRLDELSDSGNAPDFTLMSELAEALRHNHGLHLVFQPKVCLKSGKPVGLEAQMRWHHPLRGELPADNFATLAEGTELDKQLTAWLVDRAICRLKRLRHHPIQLPVTISLHERDVADVAFAEKLAEKMLKAGLPVSLLIIKIVKTEHIIDSPAAMLGLEMLRRLGFSMSWEDAAKGYSKIRYLRQSPPVIIKLNNVLANAINAKITSRLIAHSIFSTLKEFNTIVLADETGFHAATSPLATPPQDNDVAYEYFNIKPMAETELDAWLRWKIPGEPSGH